jgi:hypothetical protein
MAGPKPCGCRKSVKPGNSQARRAPSTLRANQVSLRTRQKATTPAKIRKK